MFFLKPSYDILPAATASKSFRKSPFSLACDTEVYFQPDMILPEVLQGYNFIDYSLKLCEK